MPNKSQDVLFAIKRDISSNELKKLKSKNKTMDRFPPEILEQIFAHLPLVDLLTIESLVCKQWREIVIRRRFMPWKKAYFHLKKTSKNGDPFIKYELKEDSPRPSIKKRKVSTKENPDQNSLTWKSQEFRNRLRNNGSYQSNLINNEQHLNPPSFIVVDAEHHINETKFRLETALPWLILLIRDEFENEAKEEMFIQIRKHSKFQWVKDWIEERMPEFAEDPHLLDVSVIPVICAIADDAWDIEEIFKALLRPSMKSCRSLVASEIMYCVALAFLVFKRDFGLPQKYHYNVFHAISFFENEFNLEFVGISPQNQSPQYQQKKKVNDKQLKIHFLL
jgi:hypothetical protein